MISEFNLFRILRRAGAWRPVDSAQVAEIARKRQIRNISRQLRALGHVQIAVMLEHDEENISRGMTEVGR